MQWSKEVNAGFSTAPSDKLYLPIDSSASRPDVASQQNNPASQLNFVRELLKLRRENPALANTADFEPLYAEKNQYPFVYLRAVTTQRVIVAINPAAKPCTVNLEDSVKLGSVRPLLSQGAAFHDGRLEMGPISFGIFAIE